MRLPRWLCRPACWVLGHPLTADENGDRTIAIWCVRCWLMVAARHPESECLPFSPYKDRLKATWLRRAIDAESCVLLGHDDRWEPLYYLFADEERCRACRRATGERRAL